MDDRHDDLEADQTTIPLPHFSVNPAIAIDHHPLRVHPDTRVSTAVNWMCQGQHEAEAIAPQPLDPPRRPASYVLVMDGEQLCGIITERDVVKWVSAGLDLSATPVSAVMATPIVTFPAAELHNPFAALETFRRHRIRHLPIVDAQNRLIGVIMPEHLRQALQAAQLLRLRRIAEVMTTQVITATPDLPAIALAERMAQHQVSCVVIVEPLSSGAEGDRPIGIVTERDIVQFHNLQLDLPTLTAAAVMSAPLVCMQPQDSLWEAHLQMQRMRVRRMVLTDQGRLAGIVTQTSILSVLDPNEMSRTIAILHAEVEQLQDQRLALLQQQTEQLNHQLVSTEQRFQAIFNNTFQFTGLLTPDGTLIEANQAALSFSGLSREQVINRPFWQVDWWAISPQTQTQLQEAIARAAQGEFVRYEVEVWGVNQQPTWLDFSIRPIHNPAGQVILLIPEGRDITALKQAQRDLEFQAACNHLIANISSRFIQLSTQEITAGIHRALQEIGQLTQVDICYIFRFEDAESTFEVTHEWLAAGIEPSRSRDQPLAQTEFPWSMQRLHQGETVYVPSVYRLPPEATTDQQGWQSFGLQSVLTIPLNDHGRITGAVGFASFRQERQWSDDNIRILQVFADILTHVTQRQQAELALQQSEQRYASLADAAPVGIFRTDAAGGCIYTNDRYQQITGLAAHSALGMGWANALHPDDRDRIVGLWQQAVGSGQPFQQDYRFQWSNGQEVWVFGQAVPETNRNGACTGYVGTLTNISATKRSEAQKEQVEQALRTSEERFRAFMEHSPTAAWVTDALGRMEYASATYQRMFLTPPEVLGRDVSELYPPAIAQIYHANIQTVVRTGRVLETVEPGIRPDRSAGEFLVFRFPLPQSSGQTAIGGIAVDITERNRAEEALRQSYQQYNDLVNRIPIGVYTFCQQPDGRQQFEYLSPRWGELNQLDPAAALDDASLALGVIHPEDLDEFIRLQETAIATSSHFVWEGRLVINGDVRWAHIESSPTVRADGAIAWDGIQYDITDRKLAELAARDSEQRYLSLAKAAPVGIFRTDTEGNCVYVNDRWSRTAGLSFVEALGTGWLDGLHPDDRDQIAREWYLAAQEQRPFQLEYRFKRPDGSISWVFGQAIAEHDAHGQVISYVGTITDITERKLAEQRLQSSEDRLKEAQHIAQLGSWELDLQTNTLLWSDENYRIFEIDPQQFGATYEAFLEAIHPDDRAMVNQAYTDSLAQRTPYRVVHRLLLPDGRIKYVQEQCQTFYNDQGQAIRSMGTIQNITELKATQDSLRVSEERLRLALRATNQGLYDLNLQTGEAIVSTEYATMLGYDPDTFEESNARWIERLHPDDRATVADTYRAYVQGEIPDYAVEFRQRTKTGEWKWILSLGSIVAWDDAGNPLRMLGTHTDISDRKQAEAERLQAEKMRLELGLLEGILDIVLAGYWDWDLLNNREYLSPGFKRMFGYADDELTNAPETWQRLIFAEDLPGVMVCLERHLASHGESPFYNEVRYRHKDGSTIWVICSGQVIEWDAAGRGLRMIGCHINITPHKQVEALLLKSDAHLKTAQRIGQLGSWEFDLRTEEIHWSDEVYRIFGREPADGPPNFETLQQYLHPDDRTPHQQAIQTTISTGQTYEIEFRIYRSDQTLRYLQARGELITDANGDTVQLVGTVLDISDRKQAEEQLRNLSDRLSLAIQSGAIGTWDWDIVHEATWDQRMYEIYGFEHLGRPATYQDWLDCLHADDRDAADAALHSALEGDQDFDIEFRIWRSDGQLRWVKATAMVQRDPEGRPLRMTGINYDITERKQAETQLMQTAAQLQASNQELEAFAYSVSHDLRSPLRAIDGFSRALLEDYGHQFDSEGKDYFDRIRSNISRMGMLIDDLLRLSRVSRSEMHYSPVNLSELAQEQIRDLQAAEPNRQVNVAIAPDVIVEADSTLMRVVLTNLLQNAWKFTSHHATAQIEFGVIREGEQLTYFVRDDGAGFDMTYANKLFGVFQRLHNTNEFPGTGIGLATVQRAIHRHGGQVWAEGAIERGATLYFTLPNSHPHRSLEV